MDVPTLVAESLGDEEVAAHVSLKGEDGLYVTPTRTIRYSAEGLLSDESVAEFPHTAERVSVSTGRRKATVQLDYGTDGVKEFAIPLNSVDRALHPVLAGVLNANDVTGPGETVIRTFRFSELTVVVTSDRLVKHIGSAVWDREFEEIPFDDITGIDIEEGNVSSQFVVRTDGRTQRIKAPNESFRAVRETMEDAILAFHGVDSIEAFEARRADDEDIETAGDSGDVTFESDVDPIGAGDPEASEAASAAPAEESSDAPTESTTDPADELEQQGFTAASTKVEPAIDPGELRAELAELEESIERQREILEAQQQWVEDLYDLIPDR
ncbi:Uncharacterized protein HSRCO_2324 [Halanaeroarchaeum sp. HSR-CO]|uniref:DUF7115 domain-containing protein n=1 Tax=Halanaeroarchaeum sp. HSR-CO TaxID=2866382 RepID=UPI00217DFE36|nr:hypothetical protein [Halanaeroarchaeum sp. HSR-CO]UWG48591.1 Uncharacterized protein HSRCO_2324 [Halanaeroarchaeum sp. HSR-CO]